MFGVCGYKERPMSSSIISHHPSLDLHKRLLFPQFLLSQQTSLAVRLLIWCN